VTAEAIQKVVESRLFRSHFSTTSEIDCFRCGKLIKRRISQKVGEGLTRCFECGAPHRYSMELDGKVLWQPVITEVVCQTAGCGGAFTLFDDELKPGTEWHCPGCKAQYGISLSVHKKGEPAAEKPA
jgi:transcription elongation factor Elf1